MTTPHHVRAAIAAQEVVAVLPGRFASTPHAWSLVTRAHAATASGAGVLTGAAALFAWNGLRRPPDHALIALPRGHRLATREWLMTFAPATEVPIAGTWGDVPVTDPARAALHEWVRGRPGQPTGTLIEALRRRAVSTDAIRGLLAETYRVRDRSGLHQVLDAFDAGAHSYLEFEALTSTFSGREFAHFIRQHRVRARQHTYHLDMYDPATQTAVELDGGEFHAAGEDRERDLERDADLATIGILTVRLSYRRVMETPGWCRRTVRAVLRTRSH